MIKLEREAGVRTHKATLQRSGLSPKSTRKLLEDYEVI